MDRIPAVSIDVWFLFVMTLSGASLVGASYLVNRMACRRFEVLDKRLDTLEDVVDELQRKDDP